MRRFYRAAHRCSAAVRAQRILGWATLAGPARDGGGRARASSRADAAQGDVQRLMYVHVPAAWVAFLSFGVVFLASVAYLKTGRIHWDRIAVSSAEIGVLFCALTIVLGSLWGRPVWGTWWTWDPRLTTTALLLLIYAGYLSLRQGGRQPGPAGPVVGGGRRGRLRGRADRAHVGGLVAVAAPAGDRAAARARRRSPAACWRPCCWRSWSFSVAYGYLMAVRLRVGRLEERSAVPVSARRGPAGRSRPPPRLGGVIDA